MCQQSRANLRMVDDGVKESRERQTEQGAWVGQCSRVWARELGVGGICSFLTDLLKDNDCG